VAYKTQGAIRWQIFTSTRANRKNLANSHLFHRSCQREQKAFFRQQSRARCTSEHKIGKQAKSHHSQQEA
jgi:hypothetical protein